jgi:release factor glutamine methyltransferase
VSAGAPVTWRALLVETSELLGGAADEARWLCQEASGLEGLSWLEGLDEGPTQPAVARLDAMVARRRAGEPLQYVLGHWSFRRLDLLVDRRVLIPRPETEQVVEVALGLLEGRPRPLVIADLGTGSGAIALSLAVELPVTGVEVWATDAAPDALDVARANLAGIGRAGANVRVVEGDWFDALPADLRGRLDLVVSNPPYVAEHDELVADVRDWEPTAALLAGPDGLAALRHIVASAPGWLAPGGWLVTEIGAAQGEQVAALACAAGLVEVEVRPDLPGRDRIAVARRPLGDVAPS